MKQALELALEALQFALHIGFPESSESQIKKGEKAYQQHRAAITAIKEALAQEKALQALHDENERLGLYKDAYAKPEQQAPLNHQQAAQLINEMVAQPDNQGKIQTVDSSTERKAD